MLLFKSAAGGKNSVSAAAPKPACHPATLAVHGRRLGALRKSRGDGVNLLGLGIVKRGCRHGKDEREKAVARRTVGTGALNRIATATATGGHRQREDRSTAGFKE